MTKPSLSHSARSVLNTCARKYKYQYVDGLEPKKKAKPLRMGTAYGMALEHWSIDPIAEYYARMMLDAESQDEMDRLDNEMSIVYGLAHTYMQLVDKHDREIEVELDNGFNGVIDGIIDDHTLVENKCLSQWTAVREEHLQLDDQVTGYIAAWAMTKGIQPEDITMEYHVALKPMIRQKKTESSAEFSVRLRDVIYEDPTKYHKFLTTSRTTSQVHEWMTSVNAADALIQAHAGLGTYPMNTNSCTMFNSKCAFFDVCAAPLKDRTDILAERFQPREKR